MLLTLWTGKNFSVMSEIQFNALFSLYMFDILVCMISLSIYNGSERYECIEKSIWQAESSTESLGDYFLSFCFFYYYSWWSICHSFFSFSFCSGQTSSVGRTKGHPIELWLMLVMPKDVRIRYFPWV